ncbi:MAG: hypothetical protein J6J42_07030 [Lachnospiraceae bacterium]|nr:hypothetical protein [Lachnospiraceae bacterium]
MKKQTNVVAIVIAVIMSVLLFPMIVGTGMASGAIFSAESLLQPGREMELYDAFAEHGGIDWIYEMLLEETGESIEIEEDLSVQVRELFPKEDISLVIKEIYQSVLEGEEYTVDLAKQEQFMKQLLMQYFDDNVEKWLREELGEQYDLADEALKEEIVTVAKESYEEEITILVMEEMDELEAELTGIVQEIYETEEYREFRQWEAEYGYSLTDRTELCAVLNLAGYIVLGICCFFLLLLLICHLFRPSGFITAGAFAVITGGLMKLGGTSLPKVVELLLHSELAEGEEVPEFFVKLVEEVFSWCLDGFNKIGMLGLSAGIILILVGILLLVIRKNRMAA